jgi:molybdopterin-guanine dinucleotide biosynthesis protein A
MAFASLHARFGAVRFVFRNAAQANLALLARQFQAEVTMTEEQPIAGVLLAGGRASRMGGGDKCLLALGGTPLLAHAIARLSPQVEALVLSANGDAERFAAFGLKVVADGVPGHAGPLAGVLAGMEWARAHMPDARAIVTAATDTPFFPLDLAARLAAATEGEVLGVARSGTGEHYAFGLWPLALAPDLRRALAEGRRKAAEFVHAHRAVAVDFAPQEMGGTRVDPFFNINMPADLTRAEALLARLGRE